MAQNKFHVPPSEPIERDFNSAPKPLQPCRWLREKATGVLHPYSEEMAKRSDLVDAYDGEYYDVTEPGGAVVDGNFVKEVVKPRPKAKARSKATPGVEDAPLPPTPPSMDDFLLDD